MLHALRRTILVQAGGCMEVSAPELPEGASVEVIILLDTPLKPVDYNTEWSEEDLKEATRQSWNHADISFGEEPDA